MISCLTYLISPNSNISGAICQGEMLGCFRACHIKVVTLHFLCVRLSPLTGLICALKQTNPFNPAFPLVLVECSANDGKSLKWADEPLARGFVGGLQGGLKGVSWARSLRVRALKRPPAVPTPSGGLFSLEKAYSL